MADEPNKELEDQEHSPPPPEIPSPGALTEGVPIAPQPASMPKGLPEKVGHWNHPEEEQV